MHKNEYLLLWQSVKGKIYTEQTSRTSQWHANIVVDGVRAVTSPCTYFWTAHHIFVMVVEFAEVTKVSQQTLPPYLAVASKFRTLWALSATNLARQNLSLLYKTESSI